MTPTIALVGRPNVGKSTLFNKLCRRKDALVADVPGLTRDRRYGRWMVEDKTLNLIDTGGLFGEHALAEALAEQTELAVKEADLVLALFDAREGLTPQDEFVLEYLRKQGVEFVPVINKVDGIDEQIIIAEFARLGFEDPPRIAAAHNRGLKSLSELVLQRFDQPEWIETPELEIDGIQVAIVGRPNVGKSTLVNRLLGEERQVVFDMPGTTKDAIDVPLTRDGVDYVLIDTAGVRRKGKVDEVTEKFSVVKALQAMDRAQVVILVLDATEGVVEQDLHVLQYALNAGAGMVVAVNKWDGLSQEQRDRVIETVDRRLQFVPWVPIQRISALHGTGVGHLFEMVDRVYAAGMFETNTSLLTRLVRQLVENHPAPAVRGRHIKIKMATRAGHHPPSVVIHGNQLKSLPSSYVRYLENGIREALDLIGNPVNLTLRDSDNPYAGKRNTLTPRQERQRGRIVKRRKEIKKKRRKS